jgi:DNA-binding response OmpR family regulator
MSTILLVEDSIETYHLVKLALGQSVHLEWCKSLGEAFANIHKRPFDLVLLDLVLPDGDGYRLCSMMQTNDQLKRIPVIFLSAKTGVADKVMGFSVGGDDFITKPFEPVELKARVESRLRRLVRERNENDFVRLGELEINRVTQRVHAFDGGADQEIDLTPIEFKLLLFLARKPNHVFSREEVLNSVWGQSIYVYARSVDTHISKLRKKLGDHAHYIQSVHGTGYRFGLEDAQRMQITGFQSDDLSVSHMNSAMV